MYNNQHTLPAWYKWYAMTIPCIMTSVMHCIIYPKLWNTWFVSFNTSMAAQISHHKAALVAMLTNPADGKVWFLCTSSDGAVCLWNEINLMISWSVTTVLPVSFMRTESRCTPHPKVWPNSTRLAILPATGAISSLSAVGALEWSNLHSHLHWGPYPTCIS